MRRWVFIVTLALLAVCCWQPRSAHAQGACTAGCVQWNYGSSSSGTTDSSVLTGVVAGHSIRVWVCSSGSGFTGFTATVGGNAATVGPTVVTGGCGMAGMAVYSNVGAGSITTVVTFTGSSPTCITCTIFVEEWAGDSTTGHDPLDGENAVYVSGSSVSVPCAMTQGTSGDTLEVFYQDSNGTTPAVTPSGYTQAYNFATRFFYYKTGGASGTNTPTFTSGSGSVDNNAVCAGFVQAGSGGGTPPLRSLMGVGR